MNNTLNSQLKEVIDAIAKAIENDEEPDSDFFSVFFQEPLLVLKLVDYIEELPDTAMQESDSHYSAVIFALEICVAQLYSSHESHNKTAGKIIEQLMSHMADIINKTKHGVSFWLPVLNAFYEVQMDLSPDLQNAYIELASKDEESLSKDYDSYLDSIRDLIKELSDLSVFDIAENYFAQSYAMPADFFADLFEDLFSIDEGRDIALLALLHPKPDVRSIVIECLDAMIDSIVLSSHSLTRLQAISYWYPERYQDHFKHWIKVQRKKGVVFFSEYKSQLYQMKGSEVDGSGAQGLFLEFKQGRNKYKLGGLLLMAPSGIKDVWLTQDLTTKDIAHYYEEAFDSSVTLRPINQDYLVKIIEHFIALSMEKGQVPSLHLLAIQEALGGLQFHPQKIIVQDELEQMGIAISPFTPSVLKDSLQRSKNWTKTKSFTESWFEENPHIDKLVNECSSFIDGVKVCRFDEAIEAVFQKDLELHRDKWEFHFIWLALWFQAADKKNEKIWQDCYFIAYAIHQGYPLKEIPLMWEIANQSVINSVETMQDRRTHLQGERL